MSLLDHQQNYSFSRYFDMGIEASDLATELGYALTRKNLQLPQFLGELDRIEELHDRVKEALAQFKCPLPNRYSTQSTISPAKYEVIIDRLGIAPSRSCVGNLRYR
jgi:hypothetical protein